MAPNRKLTVCIPTYNRLERLEAQIRTLCSQSEFEKIELLICDNHSNYDITSIIKRDFPHDNIHVIVRPFNLGAGANIASLFLDCTTDWMWTLGDDDLISNDSLNTVLIDIENHPETVLLKYSIVGNFVPHKDCEVHTIKELIDYFGDEKRSSGDLIFLSNNVYNRKIAMNYYGETILHCYSRISQLLPAFYCLSKGQSNIRLRSKQIVEFLPAPTGTSWGLIKVALGISIVPHLQLGLSLKDSRRLSYIISRDFKLYNIILTCLQSDRKRNKYYYQIIYKSTFRYSPKISDHFLNLLFYFQYYTYIDIVSLLKKVAMNLRDKGIFFKK